MNVRVLLTRPEHDDTTFYLSQWSREAIALAKEKGMDVLDLNRERANRKEVEGVLDKISPDVVVFNGHGSEDMVTGHKNEPLIIAGENEGLLRSKLVYAISCRSAKTLGPESIKAGAVAYTGYDDDFIFVTETEKVARPLEDETAELFLSPSNSFIKSLLKGNSVGESHKRAENAFRENILKIAGSDNPDINLIKFLVWDMRHFVSQKHGRENIN